MSDADHWDGCWEQHHGCALRRIRELDRVVAQLQNGVVEPEWMARIREGGMVPCGEDTQSAGQLTHKVHLTLHTPEGPTWRHPSDDPPCR